MYNTLYYRVLPHYILKSSCKKSIQTCLQFWPLGSSKCPTVRRVILPFDGRNQVARRCGRQDDPLGLPFLRGKRIKSKTLNPFHCSARGIRALKTLTADRSCHVPRKSMRLRTVARWNAKDGSSPRRRRQRLVARASSSFRQLPRAYKLSYIYTGKRALFFGLRKHVRAFEVRTFYRQSRFLRIIDFPAPNVSRRDASRCRPRVEIAREFHPHRTHRPKFGRIRGSGYAGDRSLITDRIARGIRGKAGAIIIGTLGNKSLTNGRGAESP